MINIAKSVVIREENRGKETGGHYQVQSHELNLPAQSGWQEKDIVYQFPIGLLSASWEADPAFEGDEVQFLIGPNMIIGAITADVAIGATVIDVQQSVIDNTFIGAKFKLDDGINADDLGLVLGVDEGGLKVTVETPTVNSFLAATPSYIKQTIEVIPHKRLSKTGSVRYGWTKIGASGVPKNTIMRLRYNNISGTEKIFSFDTEILY